MITPFCESLQQLINQHSLENNSGTPDFILARYLENCLSVFNSALQTREAWYNRPITTIGEL